MKIAGRLPCSVGDTYGRLQLLTLLSTTAKDRRWLTVCTCGNRKEVSQSKMRAGVILSCGCLRSESTKARATKHGKVGSKVYKAWQSIMQRCYNPKDDHYQSYGALGVTVQKELQNFEAFYLEIGDAPDTESSVDRADNTKGYICGNLRWASKTEQAENRSTSVRFEYRGQRLSIRELAKLAGMSYTVMYSRLSHSGYSVEDAVNLKKFQKPTQKVNARKESLYA